MTRLNPHAKTTIYCVALRERAPDWWAMGDTRAEAERFFNAAMSAEMPVPAYRVVAQYKVDQFDRPETREIWN